MFQTEDLIFVPEDSVLILDDVYHWRRLKFDVRRYGIRLRATAFDEVVDRVRGAQRLVEKSPRFAETHGGIIAKSNGHLQRLAQLSGAGDSQYVGELVGDLRNSGARWWLQIGDVPAESFFPEDYERELQPVADATPYFTFGSVRFSELDGLEVPLSGEGEEGMPFALDVPTQGGLTRWTMPAEEPLALIREYCGARGVSAHGRSVNIDTLGDVASLHQFCTPLGRIGPELFVTLYCHYPVQVEAPILGRLRDDKVLEYARLLELSSYQLHNEGPTHRVYVRESDVVHLYCGLPGHESEGLGNVPSFLLVAKCAGQSDPLHRAELYEAIREAINAAGG